MPSGLMSIKSHRRGASGRLSRMEVRYSPYLFISPFFIIFAVTGLFPLVFTGWISLFNWTPIGGAEGFVGVENYVAALTSSVFWTALRNTLSIFVITVVPQLIFATLIALSLASNIRAGTFWRMAVLLPYVAAPVAVGIIFGNLYADQFGLINAVLKTVGIPGISWHSDSLASHLAISTMVNFRWTGYNALILLAALLAVPSELYDSAAVDGAARFRTFFSVTLPQIRPTMIFVVITATIGGLQIFDEARTFDQAGMGGANNQWLTLTMYLYNLGWTQSDFGRASAVAFLLLGLIIVVALLNLWATRAAVEDELDEEAMAHRTQKRSRLQRLAGLRRGGH